MKVTIDVAREAEVSVATASMAINTNGARNAETRNKVLKIAQKLAYVPNYSAASLCNEGQQIDWAARPRNHKSLIMFRLWTSWQSFAEQKGYTLLFGDIEQQKPHRKMYIESFMERQGAGRDR